MNRTVIISIILTFLVLAGGVWFFSQDHTVQPTQDTNNGRVMSIESYVTQNISSLSPEKEVLGGSFYVTSIQAENGIGVVSYEDGHNAYTADFTYSTDPEKGITIHSFTIHK